MDTLKSFWNNIYYSFFENLDLRKKALLGFFCILGSIIVFIFCTRGKSKGNIVNNWFLFWISLILFIIGFLLVSN